MFIRKKMQKKAHHIKENKQSNLSSLGSARLKISIVSLLNIDYEPNKFLKLERER
jgi:hypothetical protein